MARIALIGDSHSQIHFDYLIDDLETKGHQVVFRSSEPGWGVRKFANTDELDDLPEAEADVAIVALGGNNHKLDDLEYGTDIADFLALLEDAGIGRTVWLGPFESDENVRPDVQDRHQWTADFQGEVLPGMGVLWVDMRPASIGGPWRNDGVHFSSSVYEDMIGVETPVILKYVSSPLIFLQPTRSPLFWGLVVAVLGTGGYFLLRGLWNERD